MANVQHIVTGAGAPSSAPPAVGTHYIDTTNKKTYVATGTASASDWGKPVQTDALTVTGTDAPTTAPPAVGAQYVDTANKKSYLATGTESAADWGEAVFKGTPAAGGGGNGIEYALVSDDLSPGSGTSINWPSGQRVMQVSVQGVGTTFTVTMRGMATTDHVHELLLLVRGSPTQKTLKIVPGVDYSVATHSVDVIPESAGTATDAGDNSYTFAIENGMNVFRFVRSYDSTIIIPQLQPAP